MPEPLGLSGTRARHGKWVESKLPHKNEMLIPSSNSGRSSKWKSTRLNGVKTPLSAGKWNSDTISAQLTTIFRVLVRIDDPEGDIYAGCKTYVHQITIVCEFSLIGGG